MTNSKSGKNYF